MARKPDWTREELILALDLYFRGYRTQLSKSHPEVINLRKLFRELNIPPFREAGSINMKLGNFVAIDPNNPNKGLDHGNPSQLNRGMDYQIWIELSERQEYLSHVAETIKVLGRNNKASNLNDNLSGIDVSEDEEYPEGKTITREHLLRERNPKAVRDKKLKAQTPDGRLRCEVCSFDFVEKHGEIGTNFAECHHIVPLSELKPNSRTKISDLAIVCANCHRMLHKARPVLAIQQLRQIVLDRRPNRET